MKNDRKRFNLYTNLVIQVVSDSENTEQEEKLKKDFEHEYRKHVNKGTRELKRDC